MKRNFQILLRPLFILALLTLIVNDHLLKDLYPGFITGKLSDFAGLFLFPIFISVCFPRTAADRGILTAIYIGTGMVFFVWKVFPLEVVFSGLSRMSSLPMPDRTKDVTDLAALSVLPFSYCYINKQKNRFSPVAGKNRLFLSNIVLVVAAISIMGTTRYKLYRYSSEPIYLMNLSGNSAAAALADFDTVLKDNEFDIIGKSVNGDMIFYLTRTYFETGAKIYSDEDDRRLIYCYITLIIQKSSPAIRIQKINLESDFVDFNKIEAQRFIYRKILKPYEDLLRE